MRRAVRVRQVATIAVPSKAGSDPDCQRPGGGSKHNTNNFDFRLKTAGAVHCTGAADCTGAENVGKGEANGTEGVKQTAHELSIELLELLQVSAACPAKREAG